MADIINASNYDIIFGIDRSDSSLEVMQFKAEGFKFERHTVSTSAEGLHDYFGPWLRQADKLRIAVAFEQPAPNLVMFFSQFENISIYPLNPVSPKKYRETFQASSHRTDQTDAWIITDLIRVHAPKFRTLGVIRPEIAQLDALNEGRRNLVDARVALTNQLQGALKKYYPQALHLLSDDLWRPMDCDFLVKWPSLQQIKRAREDTIIKFFHKHGSRSHRRLNARLILLRSAVPLIHDECRIQPLVMAVQAIISQLRAIVSSIKDYDVRIKELFGNCHNAAVFKSMPGAGPQFAPRLICAFEITPELWTAPEQIQRFSGVAPITIQSGKMRRVVRRYACPAFLRQSFHEWAKESWKHSAWAKAYYYYHKDKGKPFHTIMRSLAYKWIRILFRCWKNNEIYQEHKYIQSLVKHGSPICSYIPAKLLKPCE